MWKQPIPTAIPGLTRRELTVFQHILLRCTNEERSVWVGEQEIFLKRGQCVMGRFEFANELLLDKNQSLRVQRIVEKLEKVNNLLNKHKYKNCSIITVLNYDEYVRLEQSTEQSVNNHRTISEQSVNTNKSVKSVESEKIVKKEKINKKEKKGFVVEFGKVYLDTFNECRKTNYTSLALIYDLLEFWLQHYEQDDILTAVRCIRFDPFWKDKLNNPVLLLRTKDTKGQPADRIGDMLQYKNKLLNEAIHHANGGPYVFFN